jgi:hypothetical protein
VDPLTSSYPWYTPYQFAGNNPIKFIDLDGLEPFDPEIKTNVILVIEDQSTTGDFDILKAVSPKVIESNSEFDNWKVFAGRSIESVHDRYKAYIGENQVKNMVIVAHGGLSHIDMGPKAAKITTDKLRSFNDNADNSWALHDLASLVNSIEFNGNLVLSACLVGNDLEFVNQLGRLADYDINIFANTFISSGIVKYKYLGITDIPDADSYFIDMDWLSDEYMEGMSPWRHFPIGEKRKEIVNIIKDGVKTELKTIAPKETDVEHLENVKVNDSKDKPIETK